MLVSFRFVSFRVRFTSFRFVPFSVRFRFVSFRVCVASVSVGVRLCSHEPLILATGSLPNHHNTDPAENPRFPQTAAFARCSQGACVPRTRRRERAPVVLCSFVGLSLSPCLHRL